MSKRLIVIGGGLGGLSAALRLARDFHVTLLTGTEANQSETPQLSHPHRPNDRPFHFDPHPQPLTMPFVLLDLFTAAGEDVRNHLTITRLDPITRYRWQDGTTFDLRADDEELVPELLRLSPTDASGWMRLMQRGRRIWDAAEPFLGDAPHRVIRTAGWRGGLSLLTIPFRMGMFSQYARTINRYVKHPKLQQVLHEFAPNARATALMIPWIEQYFGAWHIEGGTEQLAGRLKFLAEKLGVKFLPDAAIDQINVRAGVATGVKLRDGRELQGDAIIDSRCSKQCGTLLMLGIEGDYPDLAHQNIFLGDNRSEHIHIWVPTRTEPALAPQGCDVMTISTPGTGTDARDRAIHELETRWGLADLSRRIVVEQAAASSDFPNPDRNFWSGSRSRETRNLYFAGSSTSLFGSGPAPAILAGRAASELAKEDLTQ